MQKVMVVFVPGLNSLLTWFLPAELVLLPQKSYRLPQARGWTSPLILTAFITF
jgi:hypothetical protein